jgi:uncharacterized protein (DUF433 family)
MALRDLKERLALSVWRFDDATVLGRKETSVAHERIVTDPAIMYGKPVIRGTRITVEHILRQLAAGLSADAIIAEHPRLTPEDVRAAQAFAADYLAEEDIAFA